MVYATCIHDYSVHHLTMLQFIERISIHTEVISAPFAYTNSINIRGEIYFLNCFGLPELVPVLNLYG